MLAVPDVATLPSVLTSWIPPNRLFALKPVQAAFSYEEETSSWASIWFRGPRFYPWSCSDEFPVSLRPRVTQFFLFFVAGVFREPGVQSGRAEDLPDVGHPRNRFVRALENRKIQVLPSRHAGSFLFSGFVVLWISRCTYPFITNFSIYLFKFCHIRAPDNRCSIELSFVMFKYLNKMSVQLPLNRDFARKKSLSGNRIWTHHLLTCSSCLGFTKLGLEILVKMPLVKWSLLE